MGTRTRMFVTSIVLHRCVVPNHYQVRVHTKKLFKRRPRLDVRKYSFGYRIVELWNRPTDKLIAAPTIKHLKDNSIKSGPNKM